MTRFARAKGSKSSNERLPDEATPWDIMKQQLQDAQASKQVVKEKTKSAKELLAGKDEPFSIGNVNNEWAEFEDIRAVDKTKRIKDNKLSKVDKKEKKKLKQAAKAAASNIDDQAMFENCSATIKNDVKNKSDDAESNSKTGDETKLSKKKKKSKKTNVDNGGTAEEADQPGNKKNVKKSERADNEIVAPASTDLKLNDSGANLNADPGKPNKKKSKKSKLDDKDGNQNFADLTKDSKDADSPPSKKQKKKKTNSDEQEKEESTEKPFEKMSKRQKRNQKKKNKNEANSEVENTVESSSKIGLDSTGFDLQGNDWSSEVKFGKQNKQKTESNEANENDGDGKTAKVNKNGSWNENISQDRCNLNRNNLNSTDSNEGSNKRKAKARDDKEHKRRKPDPGVIKMIINGMEIEVVKYDGFPVKKEDAERLKELKKNMIIKGIPRSEINAAMKLERRKAEKALGRERKRVCFHCRKSGHNLSDCPELGRDEAGSGYCFKCGSTEHTHFECKVTRGQEFRFASCFICREQGHIARQCPDNPKGLYPQGGACKLCGDVTHLKKDCPDAIQEKEETNITVEKIADNRLESLDEDGASQRTETNSEKPKNKIVKF